MCEHEKMCQNAHFKSEETQQNTNVEHSIWSLLKECAYSTNIPAFSKYVKKTSKMLKFGPKLPTKRAGIINFAEMP